MNNDIKKELSLLFGGEHITQNILNKFMNTKQFYLNNIVQEEEGIDVFYFTNSYLKITTIFVLEVISLLDDENILYKVINIECMEE